MRKKTIRMVLGMVVACAVAVTACAKGDGGLAGTGKSGADVALSGGAGSSGGQEDTSGAQENSGTGQTGDAGTGQAGAAGTQGNAGSTLIPLLVDAETNALTLGSYEWGGRIVTDGMVRRDALEARLRSINAEIAADADVTDVYVTRSDETAVSIVIVRHTDDGEEEAFAICKTYVLNPETGKELRLADVVLDTDAFANGLRDAGETQKKPITMPGEQTESLLVTYTDDTELLEMAQKNWTLDYDGVTVYPQNIPDDGFGNVPSVTLCFDGQEDVFSEAYTAHPQNYMVQMVPGRTYTQLKPLERVRVDREGITNEKKVPQYNYRYSVGEGEEICWQIREYPTLYLVYLDGNGFVLNDQPRLDHVNLPDSYVIERKDLVEEYPETEKGIGELLPYGFADRGALNPLHLRLYDDMFTTENPLMQQFGISGYAYYAMKADGTFEKEEGFWYLEGAERSAARQIDTLGYRLYDTETLVSKQIARGMELVPYRTDGKTFFEFAGNGDVFRFEIEGLGEDAKLNGTYTFDMLFGT